MSELNRIYNTMQENFKEIFNRLDDVQVKQAYHKKDIEYIKEKLNDNKDNRRETRKLFAVAITSMLALVGSIFNILVR